MGLAFANSVANWRTWGGTSEGGEVAMSLSYGYSSRKRQQKNQAVRNIRILMVCTPINGVAGHPSLGCDIAIGLRKCLGHDLARTVRTEDRDNV
jgi:hypothetical protein